MTNANPTPQPEDYVRIFDTTLRDGEQAPGCTMNTEEKISIARQLERLNVDVIEAGFAASSPGDFESVSRIAQTLTGPRVLSLSRTRIEDVDQALAAVDKAKTPGIPETLQHARRYLTPASASNTFALADGVVRQLGEALLPYRWIEGEQPAYTNFNGMAFGNGCSAGVFLRLDRRAPPAFGVYQARYAVEVRQEASHEIWIAGRVPGRSGNSPLIWQIDDEPANELKDVPPAGGEYAPGMAWFLLGKAPLKPGHHELTLVVPQPAEGTGARFSAGIDVVVVSPEPFRPSGVAKPGLGAVRPERTEKKRK